MNVFFAICAALFVLMVGVATVFLVQTLVQVRQTARRMEILADNMNNEVLRVQNITHAAANIASAFGGTVGKSASFGFNLLSRFLKRRNDRKWTSARGDGEDGRPR